MVLSLESFCAAFELEADHVSLSDRLVADLAFDSLMLLEVAIIHEEMCGPGCARLELGDSTRVGDVLGMTDHGIT